MGPRRPIRSHVAAVALVSILVAASLVHSPSAAWAAAGPVVQPGSGIVAAPASGPAVLDVRVTLSSPSADPVTVPWTTLDVPDAPESNYGPEAPPTDYVASSGTVTFAPGQTTAQVSVPVVGNTTGRTEYVVVSFHDPVGAAMGGFWGLGFGFIAPAGYDPVPTVTYAFPLSIPVPAGGTTLTTTLTLDAPATHVVTVHWSTAELGSYYVNNGFAVALIEQAPAEDYVAASGTVTFLPGDVSQPVSVRIDHCTCPAIQHQSTVPVNPDHGEMVWLTASDATGAVLGPYFSNYADLRPGQPNLLFPGLTGRAGHMPGASAAATRPGVPGAGCGRSRAGS